MSYVGNTPANQNFVAGGNQFSGTGSQTVFTLSRNVNTVFDIFITVSNVPQDPFTAYTVSGNTLTFDSAPPSGTNNIDVVYRATNTQYFVPSPLSVGSTQIVNGSVTNEKITLAANASNIMTALNASGSAPIYAARAWVNFNGTGTVAIRASGNVSSITDNGTGNYTVNFTDAMPDANYSINGAAGNNDPTVDGLCAAQVDLGLPATKTTTSARIYTGRQYSPYSTQDLQLISVAFFR